MSKQMQHEISSDICCGRTGLAVSDTERPKGDDATADDGGGGFKETAAGFCWDMASKKESVMFVVEYCNIGVCLLLIFNQE